ncbi:MAG: cobalamin-dependent protein [Gammaproteobacteria bacterium]
MPEFDFSEGYQRLAKAMGTGASEVPFIAQMHEFSMQVMQQPGHQFYTDAEMFVRGICTVARDYRFDTPSFIWDAYNIEAEALGVGLVLFDDMAPALDNVEPFIRDEKDLARLKSPDPSSAGRMPMVAEIIHQIKELTGDRPPLCFCGPFTMAAHLMTFELLVVAMRENPALVHRVMEFVVDEVLVPYCQYMHKQFPDLPFFDGSDATASLPFITQDMQKEFSEGPILRLQKQLALPCYVDNWWGDSFTDDKQRFWDSKLKVTPDYFKIQDPDLWKVGLAEPIAYAKKHDKPIVLGVDNNIFQNGPDEAIRQRVYEYMEAIEQHEGRGCVYFCSLSAVTPADNVRVAIDAVRQFREGDRPWAGQQFAGTPEARGETGEEEVLIDDAALIAAAGFDGEVSAEDQILDEIFDAVLNNDSELVTELVTEALEKEMDVHVVLNGGLIAAMDEVGDEFAKGAIFVPEMLMAARAMKAGLQVIRPILTRTGAPPKGKIVLATVQGDVHDIGKNLVGMMLEGAGYDVIDIGVNVTPDEVLEAANEMQPDVVGLSALLTTSMPSMQKTVALFKKVKSPFPVIVGGAPVTEEFADHIGADGYGENAPRAVETVHRLVAAGKQTALAS